MSNIDKQAKSVIRELIDDARSRRLGKLIITADEMEALLDELEAAEALNKHLELAIRKAEGCSEALRRKTEAAEKRIAELESALNRHYEIPDVYDIAIKQFESLAKIK